MANTIRSNPSLNSHRAPSHRPPSRRASSRRASARLATLALVSLAALALVAASPWLAPTTAQPRVPEGMLPSDFPHGIPATSPDEHLVKALERVVPTMLHIRATAPDGTVRLGSAFIHTGDGEALTCWSLVGDATSIRVMHNDGRWFDATLRAGDASTGLAVLALGIEPGTSMINATLGHTGETNLFDPVIAVGMPFGLSPVVSYGRLAAMGLTPPGRSDHTTYALTDAHVGAATVGGPLVAADGRVIGVITGEEGLVIPISTFHALRNAYQAGVFRWPDLGMELAPIRDFANNIAEEGTFGCVVRKVTERSPAADAGLMAGDRILEAGGVPINAVDERDMANVRRMLGLFPKGQPLQLMVRRGESIEMLTLVPPM